MSTFMMIITAIGAFFKKYWKQILIGLAIVVPLVLALIYIKKYHDAENEIGVYSQNNKSLIDRLQEADNEVYQLSLTVDDLHYFNDSVTAKLLRVQDSLKIKDKHLKELQYLYTHFQRHDTLELHDTIFRDPDLCVDTIIGDRWMNTEVHLHYPNIICVAPNVVSEKEVIIYTKREPIKPSKCKFVNFFRKKHTYVKVIVNEENPYIENQQNVFIEVQK